LLRRLQALGEPQAFGIESWRAHAESIMRLLRLDDEVVLNDDRPFSFALKSLDLRGAAFEPGTPQLSRIEDVVKLAVVLEKKMESDPKLPPAGETGRAAWRQYKAANATDWNAYADQVRQIRQLYFAYGLDNYPALCKLDRAPAIVYSLSMGKPPQDLATALMQVRSVRDRAADRLGKIENGDPEARRKLQGWQERLAEIETFERQLSGLQSQLRNRQPDARFDPAHWTSLYKALDGTQGARVLGDFWACNYVTVRSELSKRAYANNPATLPAAARDYFETLWTFDAEQATLQLGGVPRGWCHEFIERKPKSVMLLQLPTNHLTLFSCGDVDDLVVSISTSDLARGNFSNVWADVSN
jgi:hypothetical protein